LHRVTVSTRKKNNSFPITGAASDGTCGKSCATTKERQRERERERERGRESARKRDRPRLRKPLSTAGKIFSLMNQDEYTPVPITLEPRSPYFALLDFCHFKANEISERQEQGAGGRKERARSLPRGHSRSMLNSMPPRCLPYAAIKRETEKRGGKISRTINFKVNLEIEGLCRDAPSLREIIRPLCRKSGASFSAPKSLAILSKRSPMRRIGICNTSILHRSRR